jgi:hypothetical protein
MVGVGERPPAADGDEARIALFREDHGCTLLLASAQRPGFSHLVDRFKTAQRMTV